MAFKLKREKKGFNGMDLFLVIIIALIIAAGVFLLRNINKNSGVSESKTVTIEYTVEFKKLYSSALGQVKEGDDVRDPDNKQSMGRVVAAQTAPYSQIVYNDNDGSVYMAEHPDYRDLLITLRAEAVHSNKGYYVNGTRILVGKSNNVWSRGFVGTGYCISIREVD